MSLVRCLLLLAALALLAPAMQASKISSLARALAQKDAVLSEMSAFTPGEGAACVFMGARGVCTAGACPQEKIMGVCPGGHNVRCCLGATAPAAAPAPSSVVGEGAACSASGRAGRCTASACQGTSFSGLCPGSAAVKCCVPNTPTSGATPAPATPAPQRATEPTGQACTANGKQGRCSLGACNGTRVAGRCPGSAANQCCIPPNAPAAPSAAPAANSSDRRSLAGPFPYSFPYSNARHVVADIAKQRIRVYDGSRMVKEWKMSSGINGVNMRAGSHGSPIGRLRISSKIGAGAPLNTIFEAQRNTGRLGSPTDSKAHMQTRILGLQGLDVENANSAARGIFIHGTNAEMQLGWQASKGCFRMGNADVVELFDLVSVGTELFVAPSNAWP